MAFNSAAETFAENYCRLAGQYYDTIIIIDGGGDIDEDYYGNNTLSLSAHNSSGNGYANEVGKVVKGMFWTGTKRLVSGVLNTAYTVATHPIQAAQGAYLGAGETIYNGGVAVNNFYNDPSGTLSKAASSAMNTGDYLLDHPEEFGAAYFDLSVGMAGGKAVQSGIKTFKTAKVIEKAVEKTPDPKKYGPHVEGPLLPSKANTFRGGVYTEKVLSEDLIVYRVYGGDAGKESSFFTTIKPSGPLQAKMDLALNPEWGNTATQVITVKIPKGTKIYEGFVEQQNITVKGELSGSYPGGGTQIYVPDINPSWFID